MQKHNMNFLNMEIELNEHLTTVRTQCARDITQQRDHFAQQEHEWQQKIFTASDATTLLRDQLATSMLRATDLNEELLQTQSNIENFVEDLSIGMELCANPPVLLLDEPTTGLDSAGAARIMSLLKERVIKKKTIIICTIH